MHVPRPGVLLRSARVVALVSLIASTSCELFDPCGDSDRSRFMTGTWFLATVDGKSLPFSLPPGSGTLTSADIDFNTFYVDDGSCGSPKKSRGQIVALYHVTNNGADKRDTQAGSFEFDHTANAVTLRALGYSIVGSATFGPLSGSGTMDVVAPIPVPLLGDVDYHLHFIRLPD